MSLIETAGILLTLAAIFGYVNHRVFRLPNSIGIMLIGLLVSLFLLFFAEKWDWLDDAAREFVSGIDFNRALMDGMLSYLLFAGALHVNFGDLRSESNVVALLASLGVVISTLLVGTFSYFVFGIFGVEMPWVWCLVFGALISPTDPVAVLGVLRKAGASKSLETKITGESLFNDGVGVVVYLALLGMATGVGGHGNSADFGSVATLFVKEAGGGLLLGAVTGLVSFYMLRSIDNYTLEILITLALVTGGYALATAWGLSGPLAMVMAGLLIGNHGRALAMSEVTRKHLDLFWELVDELLNALLFLLIGLEIFMVSWKMEVVFAGLVLIAVVLCCRLASVSVPVLILHRVKSFPPGVIRMMTWGGLRGGISVALALGIPKEHCPDGVRETILTVTYLIVIFSIAVQGLTLKPLVRRMAKKNDDNSKGDGELEVFVETGVSS